MFSGGKFQAPPERTDRHERSLNNDAKDKYNGSKGQGATMGHFPKQLPYENNVPRPSG
jgi:hypothetical protein